MKFSTFATALMAFLLAFGCSKKTREPLRLVTTDTFPPFCFAMKGKTVGIDVELAEMLAKKLDRPLEIQTVPFVMVIPALLSNKADVALCSLARTEERMKYLNFSEPYFKTAMAIVSHTGAPCENFGSLSNFIVGVEKGSSTEAYCMKHPMLRLKSYEKISDIQDAFRRERINAGVFDMVAARVIASGDPFLAITSEPFEEEDFAAAVQKGLKSYQIVSAFNEIVKELKAVNGVDGLMKKWSDVAEKQETH